MRDLCSPEGVGTCVGYTSIPLYWKQAVLTLGPRGKSAIWLLKMRDVNAFPVGLAHRRRQAGAAGNRGTGSSRVTPWSW